jgi:hypothetical protein
MGDEPDLGVLEMVEGAGVCGEGRARRAYRPGRFLRALAYPQSHHIASP